ncbi:MAG: phosphoglucomutase (alpha-D-glucose-1,6-bisphosphate-dependent) [Actinomyces urogenitalis]|jgi:phosphoglucomutase|uniref:phosphoglucomutase (alpha-D-glucose-1,6-bisphosphate-dependent) n=1 Tax=Actinomyces urogenitalis TaxID=103621 RepID=UPI000660D693|nr:phosphoglucomutase (alpha-D-glucose-1,6-bisphosphate-dependent) [Actinomyces urogenitalis]MBS6072000.1 phosphoglucomutase (alpha-D-glucose-1,6-bisphosphate-dependent) [Actinomyces urogenitalis]MDU0863927.1 phosphoglucomutase (alpha-D-glucose-1,6-bisphosphate-dependent) [Actinomyces urogenitalis]MDU0874654.1 phosphoglucomutase (alpha-D-glucose-1,6-bisphosphate-dependent) [Actinomyces urogenitalis]MDU1564312.1 phosphoglucomutase (alpha-D-glucose-1,6-bisphosphate-dependent) [Actinomyces urogeni
MHPRAGQPARPEDLIDVDEVVNAYYDLVPDPAVPEQRVVFGTSGHRGSSLDTAFNEAHIIATTAAIVEYRRTQGTDGVLYIGRDTHALSEPAWRTAIEVLTGAGVTTAVDARGAYTPTPAVSHSILLANGAGTESGVRTSGPGLADGIVVTPSHNPPRDGGFKYNPPHGGPADSDATSWIAARANELLADGWDRVKRVPIAEALDSNYVIKHDYLESYVADLENVIDVEAIREAGVRIGADPLGGASVDYWGAIAERYGLDLTVVNPTVDPAWSFMTLDWDGKIRMDCSSPNAMASLRAVMTPDADGKTPYDVATGNDADSDRHGIVTPDGLMNPNHYLAVAIEYLFTHRPQWPATAAVGKTLVSSSLIDRVVAAMGRTLVEVPVGFKHFVPGLIDGSVGFGGEESAGASFLRKNGTVWSTDKDGIILALLASEIIAVTGKTPSQLHEEQVERFGASAYARIDAAATKAEKAKLAALSPEDVTATELAGEPIVDRLVRAPGNDAPIGGLKVTTENAWFAARPSGTEDVYKIYAESFKGAEHLAQVQEEAKKVVAAALAG